jgi:hypothetical protein
MNVPRTAVNFRPVAAYPDQNLLNPALQWFVINTKGVKVSLTLEAGDRDPCAVTVADTSTLRAVLSSCRPAEVKRTLTVVRAPVAREKLAAP